MFIARWQASQSKTNRRARHSMADKGRGARHERLRLEGLEPRLLLAADGLDESWLDLDAAPASLLGAALVRDFFVNSTEDTPDANLGDGLPLDANGKTSLRAAVMEANFMVADTVNIHLPAGTYLLTRPGLDDVARTGDLDVSGRLNVIGSSSARTIIDAGRLDRVFEVGENAILTLSGVTIQHGLADKGGGILNNGTLTVQDSTIRDNAAEIEGDFNHGGGILNNNGSLTVVRSLITGNFAGFSGAGISQQGWTPSATIVNSTISGNYCQFIGGGISGGGTMSIVSSTIVNNVASHGGGLGGGSKTMYVRNTIVAANHASFGPDVNVEIVSEGYNLVGDTKNGSGFAPTDLLGITSPLFGPLQDNGGSTWTHALYPSSPAVDAGDNAGVMPTDQRGQPRIADGNGDGNARVDIGAVEYTPGVGVVAPADPKPMALSSRVFYVNTTDDAVDANPGDGIAAAADGRTTLRAAVMEANALIGEDVTINVPAGLYLLTLGGTDDTARAGDLDISGRVAIVGAATATTVIDGARLDRIFQVLPSGIADLHNLTITHGRAEKGAGIHNVGTLTVTDVAIRENYAETGSFPHGGGIYDEDGRVTINRSLIANNFADFSGGGIHEGGFHGTITIYNSTISGNKGGFTGGIDVASSLTLLNTTVINNFGTHHGGVASGFKTVTMKNSLVAGNHANFGPDVNTEVMSQGHNLIGTTKGGTGFVASDLVDITSPYYGALEDNGGPTWTHALYGISPAIDAGDNSGTTTTDQRNADRVVDGNEDGFAIVDIGAFEYASSPTPPAVILSAPAFTSNTSPVVTVTATDNRPLLDGTIVYLDIDLNHNSVFDANERGYSTGALVGGFSAVAINPGLPEGAYLLRARVYDRVGNEGQSELATMVVDLTAPTVTLHAPAYTMDSTPSVVVTGSDASGLPNGTAVLIDVDLNQDGDFLDLNEGGYTQGTLSGGTATLAVTPALAEGPNTLRARITDPAGNQGASASVVVVVDTVVPTVELTAPAYTNTTTPSITIRAIDGNGLPDGTAVWFDVDFNADGDFSDPGELGQTQATLTAGEATFNTLPLASGAFRVRGRVADLAGGTGTSAVATMVVDLAAPAVTLSAPSFTSDVTPDVVIAATDANGLPNGTAVTLDVDLNDDGDFSDLNEAGYLQGELTGGTVTLTIPGLTEKVYRLRARVTDRAGNEGASSVRSMGIGTAAIHGRAWEDRDGDGGWDPDEPALSGVIVYLDLDDNGQLDPNEPSVLSAVDDPGTLTTDETGRFAFNYLPARNYVLAQIVPTDFRQTFPAAPGSHRIAVAPAELVADRLLGNMSLGPRINGGGPYYVAEGGSVMLDASQSTDPDGTIVAYAWDFDGDGQFDDAAGPTPSFSAAGLDGPFAWTVGLKLTDNDGRSNTGSVLVNVTNLPPTAHAGGAYTVDQGSAALLDASGSSDPGNDIVAYEWDLDNDGQFDDAWSDMPKLNVAWTALAGLSQFGVPYEIALRVTDGAGAASVATSSLTIYKNEPLPQLAASPTPAAPGQAVNFSAAQSTHGRPDRNNVRYEWDFDYDGARFDVEAVGTTASRAYARFGHYTVGLRVIDDNSPARTAVATTVVAVTEGNHAPVARPEGPYRVTENSSLVLRGATSFDPDALLGDRLVSYQWDIGGDGTIDFQGATVTVPWSQLQAFVQPGESQPVRLVVTDSFGLAGVSETQLMVVESLGEVEYLEIPGLDPSAGDIWYQVKAKRQGPFTVMATTSDANPVQVAVYADPNGVALQTSTATEDGQRLDLLMNQGQTFYIRVSGTADEVDLLLVNLVQQTSTGVTIFGTADSDVFEFRPDGSAYAASINGIGYRFTSPLLRQFRFEGGAGNDAAVITGTTQAETASFLPGGASLTRMAGAEIALAVAVLDTEEILINGGGGSDSASLDDSDGDDTLLVTASSMSLSGTTRAGLSYVNTAENFAVINAYARVVRGDTRGNDTVTFQPSPTRDQYKGYSDESRMRYGMLSRRAKFFEETYVYASPGAKDTVILYGTAGNETLNASRDLVTFEVGGRRHEIHDAYKVTAIGGGGAHDRATLTGSASNEIFRGLPFKSTLYEDKLVDGVKQRQYELIVRTFDHVIADMGGGFDKVQLIDSAYDDMLTIASGAASIVGRGLDVTVSGFSRLNAVSYGGRDSVDLTDTPGDDRLVATPGDVKLYTKGVSDPLYTLLAFEQIAARRTSGVDKAQLAAGVENVELLNGWLLE
ncbi:MAG: PKD domain-containing protein [Thermoguttaceae bacterium]|nr:PKD domain-containing protein [Thermoguttaceae bacterium]